MPLRGLSADRFLREIRHFLWIGPSMHGNAVDAGWSCRDHAWITALLSRSLGHEPAFFHGEAFFVKAATKKSGNIGFYQRPHSWVVVESIGAVDLSIKSDFSSANDHLRIPLKCIYADECLPRGKNKVFFFDQTGEFSRALAYPEQLCNQVAALYLAGETERLHDDHLQYAAGWIGSPLIERLDAVYGDPSDLYAALLLHLHAFLEGHAPSLSGLPQEEAWHQLADTRKDAIERARRCIGAVAELPA